jgi:PmbA protein
MRCPAVLDNRVATEILEVIAPAFLAENVQKGKSLLAGRMGEDIFSPMLRIRDDGTLPGGMGTAPFDGEGVPQQNTVLVDKGRLEGYLYDTYRARKAGMVSTGNATRGSSKSPPLMGVSNFFIDNGDTPFAGLLQGLERFLIERGSVTSPVKGIAIAGNIMELFHSVELVGNDLRFFGVVGAPSLRIALLDVSGE